MKNCYRPQTPRAGELGMGILDILGMVKEEPQPLDAIHGCDEATVGGGSMNPKAGSNRARWTWDKDGLQWNAKVAMKGLRKNSNALYVAYTVSPSNYFFFFF